MAEKSKKRVIKTETVRERAEKSAEPKAEKPRRLHRTASKVAKPVQKAIHFGRREYYLPLPDNRVGRVLNKRRRIIPRFFRDAWAELRQVSWPTNRETFKLTLAVFTFALIFGVVIAITDYGLDKLFKEILLK